MQTDKHSPLLRPSSFLSHLFDLLKDILPQRQDIAVNHYFSPTDIAALHEAEKAGKPLAEVDNHTWRDLGMDAYHARLSAEAGIFGRQMLYARLRGGLSEERVSVNAKRIEILLQDKQAHGQLATLCKPLRLADTEVGSLFAAGTAFERPAWSNFLWLFQLALVFSFAMLWFSPYAMFAVVAVVLLGCGLQLIHHARVLAWGKKARSLQIMLRVANDIRAFSKNGQDVANPADLTGNPLKLSRSLNCSSLAATMPVVGDYLDWFFADNIRHYYKSRQAFVSQFKILEQYFREVADLEADIFIAEHLQREGRYCRAKMSNAKAIELVQAVHPSLKDSLPICFSLHDKSAFISGKNGSGKSTFLRIIGVNLLVGRAFGFCYAEQALVPRCPLYSSIRNEDSLEGGESLYTSELLRAKALLDACKANAGAICLIDEIFRGTNHVESVSAAAAVLYEMAEHALVIVSSHNLILGPLLGEWFKPLYVERHSDGKSIALLNGLLLEPNGIELLAKYGYGSAIQSRALDIAAWLNGYLSKPSSFPDISKLQ